MKPLYVFRHIHCEGPGYLAEVLDRLEVPYRLIAIDQDQPVPVDTAGCSGLVFMGGPMSANDSLPWIEQELALIRTAADRKLPILGHCLGGQLISKALGGEIMKNRVREIGWHAVSKADNATTADWLDGQPDTMELFHWHGETFSIPAGAGVILENGNCPHQAFALDNILALQCHVEMTAPMVQEWSNLYADELDDTAPSVQSAAQMTGGLDEKVTIAQQVADRLYRRWLRSILRP
ncbi:MAG: type 1 glutamine amidotransferase [Gammaproteobacteria bacterium]|nr:type 1 glutamine amidotransferase [Gammaproteobacteria bacterium]